MSQEVSWQNWAGNQTFSASVGASPASVAELSDLVSGVAGRRGKVRVEGSGHSFTSLVETPDTLIDLRHLTSELVVDSTNGRARIPAGMRLHDVGPKLWRHGFAIANQGDVDVQTLAGAVSTGTKGSGTGHGTMSARITGATLVNGIGEVLNIADDLDELHAVQVSLGLLGGLVKVELAVVPR